MSKIDLRTVYREWLEERRKAGMEPLSSDAHIHIMALIERFENAERDANQRSAQVLKEYLDE